MDNRQSYVGELSKCVAMMAAALKGADSDRDSLSQAWVLVIAPTVKQQWLEPSCQWFLRHATWFPTPAEFIEKSADLEKQFETQVLLNATMEREKAIDAALAPIRRQHNIDAGIDPDRPIPIRELAPLFKGLAVKMLP